MSKHSKGPTRFTRPFPYVRSAAGKYILWKITHTIISTSIYTYINRVQNSIDVRCEVFIISVGFKERNNTVTNMYLGWWSGFGWRQRVAFNRWLLWTGVAISYFFNSFAYFMRLILLFMNYSLGICHHI